MITYNLDYNTKLLVFFFFATKKMYVIMASCYKRNCVMMAAILNINSIMFNIVMKRKPVAAIFNLAIRHFPEA